MSSSGCFRPKPVTAESPLDGSMYFTILKQPKEAFEVMQTLRQSNKLCDVTLVAEQQNFRAHRVVLAAASPYFRAMFCTGMRESCAEDVQLQGIKPCILATLIQFAYTSELHVSELNVCSLLPAATMFQMSHVVEACCTFLEHQLDPSNCIGIARFAMEHGCRDLYHRASRYMESEFSRVCQSEEFLQMSADQLMQVIQRDEINVRCESEVYLSVISWVCYEMPARQHTLEHLLSAVRCHFLTPGFLEKQLQSCDLLKQMPTCREYIGRCYKDLTLHKCIRAKCRQPPTPPVIYVSGGYLRHSLSNVECYNPTTHEWHRLADLPMPRSGVSACVVQGRLYVIGGRNNSPDGNVDSGAVDCYDPTVNTWQSCAGMSVARNRVGTATIDGLLYAVGGSHGGTHHKSVERYDPSQDSWANIATMDVKRIGVGAAVVNRLLYAVGGFDGVNRLSSVECYHPENDEWCMMAPMNTPRSGAGVVALDQCIYAVGGYDSTFQLPTVERYDVAMNTWDFVAAMSRPRSALSTAVIANKIYAVGGYDGSEFLSTVESYNPEQDEWREETSMCCGRSGHGVATGAEPKIRSEMTKLTQPPRRYTPAAQPDMS